jgi:hypothetical protein
MSEQSVRRWWQGATEFYRGRNVGWRHEHGQDYGPLLHHEIALRLDADNDILTMTLIHPSNCGCDFYLDQLELEG